ncbi:nitroreductase family protein [candidate division KSB1 bacterium]
MDIYEVINKRRTIRKFQQKPIPEDILKKLINTARIAPSGSNMQPLKFIVVNEEEYLKKIFAHVKWAAYLAPGGNPEIDERPTAYIVVCIDNDIRRVTPESDAGAAVENILLAAVAENIGSCWMKAVDRPEIKKILNIPEQYDIDSVVSLGYPKEESVMEELADSIKYWKDEKGIMHVPKRKLDDILFWNKITKDI